MPVEAFCDSDGECSGKALDLPSFSSKSDFSKLKIALVADSLTSVSLALECRVRHLTPLNSQFVLRIWRPDIVLVESAWQGHRNAWKHRIAAYPDNKNRTNAKLAALLRLARDQKIPTVFWNKEDDVHFDRFKDSASLFDTVFTVDSRCIDRYRALLGPQASVDTLMFAVQPRIHHFEEPAFSDPSCNFVGSYSRHIHSDRRAWQDILFDAAVRSGLGLTFYDRNSDRKSEQYRLEDAGKITIRESVSNIETPTIYRRHRVSLNVNTIIDSPTMFSRRLVEILASGGIALTPPSLAVEKMFAEYCLVASDGNEALEHLARFRNGVPSIDRERVRAAAEYVASHHTWAHRLEQICSSAGI